MKMPKPPERPKEALLPTADILHPLPRKVDVPILDAHCHASFIRPTALMLKAGAMFGVTRWAAIVRAQHIDELRRRFGERLVFNVWLDYTHAEDPRRFARENIALVKAVARKGARCIKFWYKPEFNHRSGFYFDDWRLDDVFRAINDQDMACLVHIADPDVWYKRVYNDPREIRAQVGHLPPVDQHLGPLPRTCGSW